jgi:hypothetical protein
MTLEIERETYVNADAETYRGLTYDLFNGIHNKIDESCKTHLKHLTICDVRFSKLEKRKRFDTAISSITGFFGGFIAVATTWIKGIFN